MLLRQTKFRFPRAWISRSYFNVDRGSVTAELAMSLPAVSLVIAITLGAFALQIERMKLVDVSATAARAAARGEAQQDVIELIAEMTAPKSPNDLKIVFEVRENMSCVILSRGFKLPGLGERMFDLAEMQCARKMGL
jgi:hypothetical protein